jgi:hypothetical protein
VDAVVRFQNPTAARGEQDGIYKAWLVPVIVFAQQGAAPDAPKNGAPVSFGVGRLAGAERKP